MAMTPRLLALAAAALLASCGPGPSNATPGTCGSAFTSFAVVYPAPGATGIPDNLPGIVFATSGGLAATSQALLVPAGSSVFLPFAYVAAAPNPLPSPNAPPSFANPVYQESASAGTILPAATLVSVYFNEANSNCTPGLLSTFTTQ